MKAGGASLAALLLAGCATTASTPLPTVDGRFADGEWRGARIVPVEGGAQMLVREEAGQLYLAVRLPDGALRFVDLYVQTGDGRLINYHTSFRFGERLLRPGWTDGEPRFTWEPTSGWQGSVAPRTDAPRTAPVADQLGPYQGYEMRIPGALIGAKPWRVRLEVRDFTGTAPDWVYPAGSTRTDPAGWAPFP